MTSPNANLKASKNIIGFIKAKERLVLMTYQDMVGCWTGGWGHNFGRNPKWTHISLTFGQAEEYFESDILLAEDAVKLHVKRAVPQPVFDLFVSGAFNLGSGELSNSMTVRSLNGGNTIEEALSFWTRECHAENKASEGLLIRRIEELCIAYNLKLNF